MPHNIVKHGIPPDVSLFRFAWCWTGVLLLVPCLEVLLSFPWLRFLAVQWQVGLFFCFVPWMRRVSLLAYQKINHEVHVQAGIKCILLTSAHPFAIQIGKCETICEIFNMFETRRRGRMMGRVGAARE